jgi:bacterioferritin (cytochrome b1)
VRHAQRLSDRILFLASLPVLHPPLSVPVGPDLTERLERDLPLAAGPLPPLKQGGTLYLEQGDAGTQQLLEHLIGEGEAHREGVEMPRPLIPTSGLEHDAAQQMQPEA